MAQGFSQSPEIDYEETYSSIMDIIMFLYLICLVVSEKLNMQLMNVVTLYLYGNLDTKIYMKVSERFKLTDSNSSKPRNTLSIHLWHSQYG